MKPHASLALIQGMAAASNRSNDCFSAPVSNLALSVDASNAEPGCTAAKPRWLRRGGLLRPCPPGSRDVLKFVQQCTNIATKLGQNDLTLPIVAVLAMLSREGSSQNRLGRSPVGGYRGKVVGDPRKRTGAQKDVSPVH